MDHEHCYWSTLFLSTGDLAHYILCESSGPDLQHATATGQLNAVANQFLTHLMLACCLYRHTVDATTIIIYYTAISSSATRWYCLTLGMYCSF